VPLKTYGKKIFLTANAGYGFLKFMKTMGTANNNSEFTFEEKHFVSKKIEAFRGISINGFRLGSVISFQLSNFWHLKLSGGWQFNLNQAEKVRLIEKDGFFLSLNTVEGNLLNNGLRFVYNSEEVSSTQMSFKNYFGGIGLIFMF
jgi:hypothetical protein